MKALTIFFTSSWMPIQEPEACTTSTMLAPDCAPSSVSTLRIFWVTVEPGS